MAEETRGDSTRRFYDTHLHAFDLTHPDYLAFAKRFTLRPLKIALYSALGAGLGVIVELLEHTPRVLLRLHAWIDKRLLRMQNLLAVMQNDLGSQFLLLEGDLRRDDPPLLDADGLHIGGQTYDAIVLTPLMMDFDPEDPDDLRLSFRRREKQYRYSAPVERKIVKQVLDLFRGIQRYLGSGTHFKTPKGLEILTSPPRIFEIYPFLGLNTRNYATLDKLQELLDKYFAGYTGKHADLHAHMGAFDGEIDHLGVHAFAGIKLYPPLGFHPWPPTDSEQGLKDREKVEHLYTVCQERGIPITVHGGSGGFAVLKRRKLKAFTAIEHWETVLAAFPDLKLCIAHFPVKEKVFKVIPDARHPLRKALIRLVTSHPNVYVDISCRATNARYYRKLKRVLHRLPAENAQKLRERVLFGTDFSIHLMWIESYSRFVRLLSETTQLTEEEKTLLGSTNPERFLFKG